MKIISFRWIHYLNIMVFYVLCGQTWVIQESLIILPKIEGANNEKIYKPFDCIFTGMGGGCLELL
jgi:hypothetical protein